MKQSETRPACPMCNGARVVAYLPKEIDRQLMHEEITVPAEPEPKQLTVAILRLTYRRDYFCPTCGYQWATTFTTETQQYV